MINKKVLIFILVLASFFKTFGQNIHAFDTVIVNGLIGPQSINETGRNLTIITAKQIEKLAVTSIDEVLQTVSGIEVQSRGGFGVQGDITMRGST